MNITLTGTKIQQDNKTLAFEKNNLVDDVINVTVDTDESWSYKLDIKYPQKCCTGEQLYNIIDLMRTGDVATVELTAAMLPFSGKYTAQLRGINGDKVYHSDTFDMWVKYSIEPGSAYDPVPSEFYQIEENITEANQHPPKPGSNGYWLVWNTTTKQYEESDVALPEGTLPDISDATKGQYLTNDGDKVYWAEVQGGGGGDKSFTFTQSVAANTWSITHNLGKYPSVTVVDSGGNVIIGDVAYDSVNALTCTFSAPFSGKAYLN